MLDSKNAHSSHFTNTSNAFWVDVMIAESNAHFATGSPHGNATFADADIIAVAESWAEHIGLTFADMTYPTDPVTSISGTYINKLERTWNEVPNHISIGLYHDLIDSGTEPISWNDDNSASTTVNDNVSGFSNHMIFNCLDANTTSISNFQTQLINTQLSNTSNALIDVNQLFNSY
jgi:hypothetical protein